MKKIDFPSSMYLSYIDAPWICWRLQMTFFDRWASYSMCLFYVSICVIPRPQVLSNTTLYLISAPLCREQKARLISRLKVESGPHLLRSWTRLSRPFKDRFCPPSPCKSIRGNVSSTKCSHLGNCDYSEEFSALIRMFQLSFRHLVEL
jgi:hypothetical protein